MGLKVVTGPTEIISVSEAADFMRIDFPDSETAVISAMITAARQWVEDYIRQAIGVQTLELSLDSFPQYRRKAILLRPPVISIISFTYLDSDGDSQTLVSGTDYRLSIESYPGELTPIGSWPAPLGTADCVKVRFKTGYDSGDSPLQAPVPPKTIRQAILMQASDLYENRSSQTERPLSANRTLENLLSMHRLEMGI